MLGLLSAGSAFAADECATYPVENRIQRLGGTHTSFAEGTFIDSVETLQSQFVKYESDIRQLLANQGLDHVADALIESIARGEGITEGSVKPGDDFEWLAWRRNKVAVTTAPVCLETTRDYESYNVAVSLEEDGNITTYHFTLPKICMNLAFAGSETVAAPVPPAPAAVIAPTPVAAPEPVAMAKDEGVNAFFGPFIGMESRTRDLCNCIHDEDSGLAGLLGGILIPLGESRNNLLFEVGAAANLNESKWSSLFADIGVDFGVGERGFIGTGIGVWDINASESRDLNVYLQGGRDAWDWGGHTVQWFVQGRVFLDNDDVEDIGTDYAVLAGLRVILGRGSQ
ncbi:MAG: hypothetical protein DHS20C01_04450 [marine bacterium B5-7]|nr:MAG: hypothetical protein DHS20C01_04450 [marine bacterium B5-7]